MIDKDKYITYCGMDVSEYLDKIDWKELFERAMNDENSLTYILHNKPILFNNNR